MASGGAVRAGRAFVEMFLDDSKLQRGLKRSSRSMKRFGNSVGAVGKQMASLGVAMSVPLALSAKVFASFEDQMLSVKAITGATAEQFDVLNSKAKELGRTTSFTAEQVAAAMTELARAGFDTAAIDSSIASILSLARATGTELAEAAEITGSALRQFGLGADQAGRVADVLTAAANNSAMNITEMGEALKFAGPIADEFGMSIEDASKAIGALANFGIKGTMAGTSLRKIMTQLADPKIRGQIEALGVSVTDGAGEFRNLSAVLSDIGGSINGLPSPQRLAILKELFGQRAITSGVKLTKAAFDQLNNAIDNAAGTADKTAATMDSGLGGSFRKIMSAAEGVAIAIGSALSDDIQRIGQAAIKVAGDISRFIAANKDVVRVVAAVAAGLIAAGAAFIIVGAGIAIMGSALAGISTIAATVASVISAIPAILAAIFSPIGLIVAAVVAVGIAIVKFTGIWDTAVNVMKSKWATLVAVFQRGGFVAAIKVAWAQIQLLFAQGASAVLGIWINMTAKLKTIWVGFSSSVRLLVFELVNGIIDGFLGLSGAVQKIINQLRGKFDKGFDVTLANVGVDNAVSELGEMAKKALGTDTAESEKRREKALPDIESKRASGIAELDANVAKARENLSKAIKDGLAKTKTAEEAAKKTGPAPGSAGASGSGGSLTPKLGGVSGTFSGAVARMLGADPNEKKNRKANEQTAEETRRTNALLRTRTVLLK